MLIQSARLIPLLTRFAVAVLFVRVYTNSQHCPCQDAPIEDDNHQLQRNLNISTDSLILCINDANSDQKKLLQKLVLKDITLSFVKKGFDAAADCNVLLKIINKKDKIRFPTFDRQLCPGVCRPVPEMQILSNIFVVDNLTLTSDLLLTCTLDGSMVSPTATISSPSPSNTRSKVIGNFNITTNISKETDNDNIQLSALLRAMFWRRIMECYEKKFWGSRYKQELLKPFTDQVVAPLSKLLDDRNQISRRPVYSLIIWIGSESKLSLIIEQAKVLTDQPFEGSKSVIGWSATDEAFSCRLDKVKCLQKKGRKFLPQSAINFMSEGWACAQRRPLRALAHTLLLLDPEFVILLDDDSYLNYNLLQFKYGESLTQGPMSVRALMMGELIGAVGDEGHLTKWGIFAGGGGYVINKKALQVLTGYELKYYEGEGTRTSSILNISNDDAFRSNRHIFQLSLYKLGKTNSEKYCKKEKGQHCILPGLPKPSRTLPTTATTSINLTSQLNSTSTTTSTSLDSIENASLSVTISVRLIDFCANMLANENTCDHRYVRTCMCLDFIFSVFIFSLSKNILYFDFILNFSV